MEQVQLNLETEALLEQVMWQIKGDMHNLVGRYNPAFTDKAEKHIKELLLAVQQTNHQELQKAREEVEEARREYHKISIGKVINECEEMEEIYKKDRLPRIALEDLKFRIIRRVTFEALTPKE